MKAVLLDNAPVVQWIERFATNEEVVGSSPARGAKDCVEQYVETLQNTTTLDDRVVYIVRAQSLLLPKLPNVMSNNNDKKTKPCDLQYHFNISTVQQRHYRC